MNPFEFEDQAGPRPEPHNLEAEMSAIGSMMLCPKACTALASKLVESDFWRPAHREIFKAVRGVMAAGLAVDIVTVKNQLLSSNRLTNAGGVEYLFQINEIVPTASNAVHYAAIVLDYSAIRTARKELKALYDRLGSEPVEPNEVHQALDRARSAYGRRGQCAVDIADVDLSVIDKGLATGFDWIDSRTTCRGYPCGQVTIIAAKTKGGKTTWMLQAVNHVAGSGGSAIVVLVADLSPSQAVRRIVKQRTGYANPPSTLEESERYTRAVRELQDFEQIRFYNGGGSRDGASTPNVIEFLRAEIARDTPDLVVIDYAQKLTVPGEQRVAQLEAASDAIAKLASQCPDTAFLLGSQVAKDGQTRYSAELEHDCGLMIAIDTPKDAPEWSRTVAITLNRFGPPCEEEMRFDSNHLAFHVGNGTGPVQGGA